MEVNGFLDHMITMEHHLRSPSALDVFAPALPLSSYTDLADLLQPLSQRHFSCPDVRSRYRSATCHLRPRRSPACRLPYPSAPTRNRMRGPRLVGNAESTATASGNHYPTSRYRLVQVRSSPSLAFLMWLNTALFPRSLSTPRLRQDELEWGREYVYEDSRGWSNVHSSSMCACPRKVLRRHWAEH